MKQTPEELSLEQALTEGMKAGLLGQAWSVNPYDSNAPEHEKWEEGRQYAQNVRMAGIATVAA